MNCSYPGYLYLRQLSKKGGSGGWPEKAHSKVKTLAFVLQLLRFGTPACWQPNCISPDIVPDKLRSTFYYIGKDTGSQNIQSLSHRLQWLTFSKGILYIYIYVCVYIYKNI